MLSLTFEHIPTDKLTLQIAVFKTTAVNGTISNNLDFSTL